MSYASIGFGKIGQAYGHLLASLIFQDLIKFNDES